jgi:hypothetical protein
MAATVTVPVLVGGGILKTEDESFPWTLTTKWHATKLADGTAADLTVLTDIVSTDPLDQSYWDSVWARVLSDYNGVYANAPAIAPANPIAL